MKLKIMKTHPNARLPEYQTPGSSGLDLYAVLDRPIWLNVGEPMSIPTGIRIELPPGYEAQVRPRSGRSLEGLSVVQGTIDNDYRGEISIIAYAIRRRQMIKPGDRIAQLVVAPVVQCELEEVTEMSYTARGENGYGSTGR